MQEDEPAGEILGASPRAIFTYGTLRADLTATGDRWGVLTKIQQQYGCECAWRNATIDRYSLYQNPALDYPLAVPSAAEDAQVVGTILRWPSEPAFAEALQRCNQIENYSHSQRGGLYRRTTVTAVCSDDGEVVEAYVYYQEKTDEELVGFKTFPDGNWVA